MRGLWSADDARAFYRHAFYELHGWVECITPAKHREDVTVPVVGEQGAEVVSLVKAPVPVRASRRARWVFWTVVVVVAYLGTRLALS